MSDASKSPSRHGTFLGTGIEAQYRDVRDKLSKLMRKEVAALDGCPSAETDRAALLLQILSDISQEELSPEIKMSASKKFTLSPQEVHWLCKNDPRRWIEYILYRYQFKILPQRQQLLAFPLYVLIEPTSVCNLRCPMCFQSDDSFRARRHMGMMPWELFKKIVDQLKRDGCKAVTLASRGEPTLHKELCDMLSCLAEAGIMDIKINTNATRLTEDISHAILAAGVSEVVFSVDAADNEVYRDIRVGGDFDAVVKNIQRFNAIRTQQYPDAVTTTRITGVYLSKRQNIDQIYRFWSQYVDEVVIKKSIIRWDTYHNPIRSEAKPCALLWERMYVWHDGRVNPCDIDYKSELSVGSVHDSSLKELWQCPAYATLRSLHAAGQRKHIFPCDRCSL